MTCSWLQVWWSVCVKSMLVSGGMAVSANVDSEVKEGDDNIKQMLRRPTKNEMEMWNIFFIYIYVFRRGDDSPATNGEQPFDALFLKKAGDIITYMTKETCLKSSYIYRWNRCQRKLSLSQRQRMTHVLHIILKSYLL